MCIIHIPFHDEHLNIKVLKLPIRRLKFVKIHDFKLILTWNHLGREYLKITCTTSLQPAGGNTAQTLYMHTWLAHVGPLEPLYLIVDNWLLGRVGGWTCAIANHNSISRILMFLYTSAQRLNSNSPRRTTGHVVQLRVSVFQLTVDI